MTTTNPQAGPGQCPVLHLNPMEAGKQAGEWVQIYDRLRERFPLFRSDFGPIGGFWAPLKHEDILRILQDPVTFSSRAISLDEPDPAYTLIPEMLDPPEHTAWRRALAPLFSPREMAKLDGRVRARAIELIEPLAGRGSVELVAEFSSQFPTTIFLELMGLPVEELETFLRWEAGILHGDQSVAENKANALRSMGEVTAYFAEAIEQRRAAPRDDLISKALTFDLDGIPPSTEELLAFCLLMFMAGLDTVTQNLNYAMVHFARNPADRARILADPALIPSAVEEVVRVYNIVVPPRRVTRDTEIRGCPVRAGDMVSLSLASASRDEDAFPDGTTFRIDRSPNNHLGFGAGPHRCLGSHLARREMRIALEEWHTRIPHYRLADDQPAPAEHGGMYGLDQVHLAWDV